MASPTYDITSAWPGKAEAPETVGQKFLATLAEIESVSPYRGWETSDELDGSNPYAISPLRGRIAEFVKTQVYRDDYGQPDPSGGYLVGAVASAPNGGSACFYARASSHFRNYANFEVGSNFRPPAASEVRFPVFRAVLLAMISAWPAPWACAQCSIWGERPPTLPGEPPFPYSGYQMPWLGYLDRERAAAVTPPRSIKTERTPDGGLLMVATEERFDPTNVEHMRPSRLMAQIMIEHGGNPGF